MPRATALSSWWTSPPPAVGLEFTARQVTAVALAAGAPLPALTRHAVAPVPAGALVPGLNAANVVDRAAVAAAVRQALDGVGRPRRIALVLPDVVARLSIVRLDSVPARAEERDQLLRWHVRKAAPFDLEQAQVAVAPGRALEGGAREFVVAIARRDIVEEYEAACAAAAAHAGVVDVAASALVHAAGGHPRRQAGDWMLVHLAPDYVTLAIVRDRVPIFFRNRGIEADGTLGDTVHQAAMYYEDRLEGATLTSVVVVDPDGADGTVRAVESSIGGRWPVAAERFDLAESVQLADRIGVAPDLSARLAAAAGIVLRES